MSHNPGRDERELGRLRSEVAAQQRDIHARDGTRAPARTRLTRACAKRLGGKKSLFDSGGKQLFAWQHDARRMKDGKITLYDNAANRARPNVHSRGLVLRLDQKRVVGKPKVQIVGEFTATPPVLGGTQGNVQTLPDGGVMVGWGGGIPRFTEFDDQGTITFEARFLTPGAETYRAYRMPWNATPPGRPDIAIAQAGGRAQVDASWNGSTTVANWRLLAGNSPGRLRPGGSVPRTGFESAIPLPTGPRYVAAQAMDADGRTLGTSRTIRTP